MQEALNCGGKNKDDWVQGNVSLEFCRLKTKNNAELAQEEETAVEKVHITLKSGFPPPTSPTPTPTCCTLDERENMLSGYSHVGRRWDWMNYMLHGKSGFVRQGDIWEEKKCEEVQSTGDKTQS